MSSFHYLKTRTAVLNPLKTSKFFRAQTLTSQICETVPTTSILMQGFLIKKGKEQ